MGVIPPIDITAEQHKTLSTLLERFLPRVKTWAYGSRAKWTSRPNSDLDLVVFAEPEQYRQVGELREAFEESNLPFRVDLFVWNEVPESFREQIEAEYVAFIPKAEKQVVTWGKVKISEIADVIGGGTPSTKNLDNFGGDIPWLTPKDLSGPHDRYVSRGARNLSQQGLDSCSARLVPAQSVLLSTRAPIGYVALAKNRIATNQGFRNLVLKDGTDSEYLYYWLLQNTKILEQHASGSTFRELSGTSLKKIRLPSPPFQEQRAIAHILGTLDDKIELNQKINKTLEEIAKAIFKSWFVDFDPVRAKAEGRTTGLPPEISDLFPDKLDDDGKPTGWATMSLGEIADAPKCGISPSEVAQDTPYIGLEHMPKRSIALTEWEGAVKVKSNKLLFKKGEVLFGKLRPYFHKVGLAPLDGICSTDIVVVAPRDSDWSALILMYLFSDEFVNYTDQTSTGTRMPRTSWRTMRQYKILLPEKGVVREFQHIVQPLLDRLRANIHNSRALASIRNVLLPKLISGELRIPDAERFLEEAGI